MSLMFAFPFEILSRTLHEMCIRDRLYRYAGEPDGAADLSAYTDAGSVSAYAEKAMQWCVKNGILTGKTSSTLAPKATATRAECAAMLQRFASLTK